MFMFHFLHNSQLEKKKHYITNYNDYKTTITKDLIIQSFININNNKNSK